MAITDDIPDDNTQPPPLSPQAFTSHDTYNLAAVAEKVSEVSLHEPPNHTSSSCIGSSHSNDDCHRACDKSSLFASSSITPSRQTKTMYQTDSLAPDRPCDVSSHSNSSHSNNTHAVSRHSINTADRSRLEAESATAVSSVAVYGRDAFMNSEHVASALDMGFDYETIRNILHLKIVQSGENYATSDDLIEALLAYNAAMADEASDDSDSTEFNQQQQQQQQQQRVTAAETTTDSSCQRRVKFDVTDATTTLHSDAAAAAAVKKQPGRKKKSRRSKNAATTTTASSSSSSSHTRSQAAAELHDTKLVGLSTKLQTSASDTVDGAERLLWNIEMENKRLKAAKTCKICLEADIGVVFIPCGHVVCCHGCASLISRCSICEAAVRDTVKIYMN